MWLQAKILQEIPGLRHVFTTRLGGVSTGDFASLNLKYPVTEKDDQGSHEAVKENRRRVCEFLGMDLSQMVTSQQIHADHIHHCVTTDAGRGAFSHEDGIPDSDGLMTQEQGLALLVMVADCYPVMLVDPKERVAAILHSGWRGTQKQITRQGIQRMGQDFGSQHKNIRVAIGPGIGFSHFEVGPEVVAAFADQFSADQKDLVFQQDNGKYRLNLPEIIRRQALDTGILEKQIETIGGCTYADTERFFSYRRDQGQTGRLGGWIAWEKVN